MKLINADKFYINYARRFSREPLKVELFKQFLDAEPTVDVLEQISDEVNKLKKVSDGNKVYVGINDVFDIIDKYKEDKE